jgi:hypothetical protein
VAMSRKRLDHWRKWLTEARDALTAN